MIYSQSYGFSSNYVQMWELDHKEGWVPKNWCFQTVELEKTSLTKLVHSKGNQPWTLIERTDAESLLLWPPDVKNWLIGKDPDSGKDWGQEKRAAEDEMIR